MDVVQITRELEKPLPAETVNGLLRIAQTYIRYAIDASNETIDGRVSDYVMIAHASAATAQSMILAEMTSALN